jgi:WS/DGAT/MGAT family acyltransferase
MGTASSLSRGAGRPEVERLTGGDSFLLHLEKLVPMHTLKVLVLDSSARGRQVTLEDVAAAVRRLLPRWPRARQRLEWAPFHRGRPFLVDQADFDISAHLDECTLKAPGKHAQLDDVLCRAVNRRLPFDRPLWGATLVHGLADGRQAVIISIHHALADGIAAITSFNAFTSEKPQSPRDSTAAALDGARPVPTRWTLTRRAVADGTQLVTRLPPLLQNAWQTRRLAAEFRAENDMPRRALGAHRNSLSRPFGPQRVCATSSHPLADFKAISRETGASINGVLHAVIADALRTEIACRGEDLEQPLLASFGIAADEPGSQRLWGNNVSVTWINLHTNIEDPVARLHKVSSSAKSGLELRKAIGLGVQPEAMNYASRLMPLVVRHVGKIRNIAHVMTANVPGPRERRWAGDVEVADFYSLAVLVPPIGLNMTAYSYAGALNIGLLTAPEVHADPAKLLARVDQSLVGLCGALRLPVTARDKAAVSE